jgi:hypothetical protein
VQPYITPAEFLNAPTSVDTVTLVVGGDANANAAELVNIIDRASSWCANVGSRQPLTVSSRTETRRLRVNRDGLLSFHPDHQPVTQLTALSVGSRPSGLSSLSVTDAWIEREQFVVPVAVFGGPAIAFGGFTSTSQILARYTYLHGWPATTLTAAPLAGDTTVTVADPTGIMASATLGDQFTIYDGTNTEKVTVASVTGSTVTLSAPLTHGHAVGAGLSSLPPVVKEAAILVTAAFIQNRSSDAIVLTNGMAPGPSIGTDPLVSTNLRMAREILLNFRRVR